jgi:hypothetical protein
MFIEIQDGRRHHLGFHKFAAISLLLIGFSPNFSGITSSYGQEM